MRENAASRLNRLLAAGGKLDEAMTLIGHVAHRRRSQLSASFSNSARRGGEHVVRIFGVADPISLDGNGITMLGCAR
jgi:hypothetical protein